MSPSSRVIHPGAAAILAKARSGQRITAEDFSSRPVCLTRADFEDLEAITGKVFQIPHPVAMAQSPEDVTAELLERLRAFRL